jgi:hypothetical protein
MQLQKEVLIDISDNATTSSAAQCDGLLLSGIVFPAAMTGTTVTFDFSFDGNTWVDVVEIDPSGWAFASLGFLRIVSGSSEAADRTINLIFKQS